MIQKENRASEKKTTKPLPMSLWSPNQDKNHTKGNYPYLNVGMSYTDDGEYERIKTLQNPDLLSWFI